LPLTELDGFEDGEGETALPSGAAGLPTFLRLPTFRHFPSSFFRPSFIFLPSLQLPSSSFPPSFISFLPSSPFLPSSLPSFLPPFLHLLSGLAE
jgi:hypothetical protein